MPDTNEPVSDKAIDSGVTVSTDVCTWNYAESIASGYINVTGTGTHSPESANPSFFPTPVAICGMALRLPGGIRDTTGFWDLLESGKDARVPIPVDRYNAKGFDSRFSKKGAIESQWGYFIDENLSSLDTSFFSFSKEELEKTDPQQRQLLEVTKECLENAGEVDYGGKTIGCYVGTFGEDWLRMNSRDPQHSGRYTLTGYNDLMIANRVSYEYDLKGPSVVIKTGCSASLIALHQACRALQTGDCTAALVAGTNLIMGPAMTSAMTTEGILSPEGSCKTFDAEADGFARGEAINAVYLKLVDDAICDGNPIRAVIRNTASNSDGRSSSLTAPNGLSHEEMMRKVYRDCGLDPAETPFVECHGTGTATGDPCETTAVGNVFGQRGVFIGSCKPNVGHSEGASGITSLIKAVLALEHGIIPPNIKFNQPNPQIKFLEKNLTVPIQATAWPLNREKRISVNSFGIGGANAHAIVESYTDLKLSRESSPELQITSPALLVFSANTSDALRIRIDDYKAYLEANPDKVLDLVYTLALRREHLPYRAYAIVEKAKINDISPVSKLASTSSSLIMVYSGQGSQWPQMGADLLRLDPRFLEDIRIMDRVLQTAIHPPKWSIELELQKAEAESNLQRAELAQPICTAIQIALTNTFRRAGVQPAAVIGHSSGEISAAYACGVLSLRHAILTAYYRGYVTKYQTILGSMAAIGMGREEVAPFLSDGIVIACENSPKSTTISGDSEEVDLCVARIKDTKPGTMARRLQVDQAYHSHHMNILADQYFLLLTNEFGEEPLQSEPPHVPFFSSVTTKMVNKSHYLDSKYWQTNLTSPVLFAPAMYEICHHFRDCLFLEIGPHSTMAGPIKQICSKVGASFPYVPSMLRNENSHKSILSAFGQLFQHNCQVQFETLIAPAQTLTDLPSYPWDHGTSYWYESRLSKDWRFRQFSNHGLLGVRIPESTDLEPAWRNILDLDDESWLTDHRIGDDVVFPFAGYCVMAGEAIRQLTGTEIGYSLRDVQAHTALVLKNSQPIEIVTTFRPLKSSYIGTPPSNSWEFMINSYTGSTWLENCRGFVKDLRQDLPFSPDSGSLLREVQSSKWYESMAHAGVVYGPSFQGMTSIRSCAGQHQASALIRSSHESQHPTMFLHPTTIDACFQLALVAIANGVGRKCVKLLPISIKELSISKSVENMQARARVSVNENDVEIVCGGERKAVLRLSGLELRHMSEESNSTQPDTHAAARLEWRPHFDFVDHSLLFEALGSRNLETKLLEEITFLCIVDSAERLRSLETKKPHLIKYRQWMYDEVERAATNVHPVLGDTSSLLGLSEAERKTHIEQGFDRFLHILDNAALAMGIRRIWENVETIFTGATDTLHLLMEGNILTEMYNTVSFGHSGFIQLFSHSRPNLRILEVGAGTGGTTQTFLKDLIDANGDPQYALYMFTDVSAGFFPMAKERFSFAPNLDFKVFDISKNPLPQGFEAQSFDLILAPNVVHATPVLKKTLENLRTLLKPNGRLVLTELASVAKTPNYIFGNFSGWWLGEADGRPSEPYVSIERWDCELREAGFTGADTVVYDAEYPHQYCAVIVSQPENKPSPSMSSQALTVLAEKQESEPGRSLISSLWEAGYIVSVHKLGTDIPQSQDVLSLLDYESNFLTNISEEALANFQKVLRIQGSRNLIWLTKPVQVDCRYPQTALSIGMAKGIRSELGTQFVTFEIDPLEPSLVQSVLRVLRHVQANEDTESLLPDREFAFHEGHVKVGRYHAYPLNKELDLDRASLIHESVVKVLEIKEPGLLKTLSWVEKPAKSSIGLAEVEIETQSIGLALVDIMCAMKKLPPLASHEHFGIETVGLVTRVGAAVTHLAVGQRVMALAGHGCAATKVIIPASLAILLPDSLSSAMAATMPFSFVTAIHALTTKGQLEEGQSVLITSIADGVGQAAVQVCRMIGAEIFAAAGGKDELENLVQVLDVPKNRIFDSRSDSFVQDVMHATNGRGVDLVLNLGSDELQQVLWSCISSFGILIEVAEVAGGGSAVSDRGVSFDNKTYCQVKMIQLIRSRPSAIEKLLNQVVDGYESGQFHPIICSIRAGTSEAVQIFTALQQRTSIGKALMEMPPSGAEIMTSKQGKNLELDPGASYLLTGGLGGLGKPLASWMVERGAKSLIFLSRHAGTSKEDQAFAAELESMGCSVTPVIGRAEVMGDVQSAMKSSSKPIKGVIHLAMILRDDSVTTMSHTDWNAVIEPKVQGTWNLHNALDSHSLDFFVLASSLFTVIERSGQCNYNAASMFLEAFCQFRRHHGMAASVVNISPIDQIGFVSRNQQIRRKLKSTGLYFQREQHLLDFFELAILRSKPKQTPAAQRSGSKDFRWKPWHNEGQFIMGLRSELPLDDPNNRIEWRRDRRMALYHNVSKTKSSATLSSTSDALATFLARANDDPNLLIDEAGINFLGETIGRRISELTLNPEGEVALHLTMAQLGIDSLTATELRRWWKQTFALDISVLEIVGAGTLGQLGETAAKSLKANLDEIK